MIESWLPLQLAEEVPHIAAVARCPGWENEPTAALDAFRELVSLRMPRSVGDDFVTRESLVRRGSPPGIAHVHSSAQLHPGTWLLGDVLVAAGCELGPNAVVFGPTIVGPGTYLGPNAEVRRSLLLEDVVASHACYIGHSIVGRRANIGAYFVTAVRNVKRRTVHVQLDGQLIDTGYLHFGSLIGDDTQFGCGVTVMPGRMVLHTPFVPPGSLVSRNA